MKDKNVVRKEPNRLFIEIIGRYDWLFEKLVDYGEKHHSVSHFIIVSSDSLKQKYQALLRQNDSIVTTVAELELKLESLRLEENYDITSVATHYEKSTDIDICGTSCSRIVVFGPARFHLRP